MTIQFLLMLVGGYLGVLLIFITLSIAILAYNFIDSLLETLVDKRSANKV